VVPRIRLCVATRPRSLSLATALWGARSRGRPLRESAIYLPNAPQSGHRLDGLASEGGFIALRHPIATGKMRSRHRELYFEGSATEFCYAVNLAQHIKCQSSCIGEILNAFDNDCLRVVGRCLWPREA